jgi:hypothetical protein
MLNTELSLSSEVQMLRHRGGRHDAETRVLTASSQTDTVKSAIHVAEQDVNCDAETASAAM